MIARRVGGATLVALLLVGAAWLGGAFAARPVHVTAYFERATGLYAGSNVTVLGVKVGTVDSVTAAGDRVAVAFHYDGARRVPADAMAAIVAPSLVSGRYVQLAPVYRGGPVMADGATIPLDRTAVPVEWDQIKEQLVRLADALGPNATHPNGALNTLVRSGASALGGNGAALRDSMDQLTRATGALAGDRGNLFATVRNLNDFVTALNQNGNQVQRFSAQLAAISQVLADNRHQLATLLSTTDGTVKQLTGFVQDNRDRLGTSVDELAHAARQLSDNQMNLANALHLAPTLASNAYASYDPTEGVITSRPLIYQFNNLANSVCQAAYSFLSTLDRCKSVLSPLFDPLNSEGPLSVNPLIQTGAANQQTPGGPAPSLPPNPPLPITSILGGPR